MHHLPKVAPPDIITMGIRFLHMNLVVGSTNIHFIANTSSSGSKHVAEIGENTELSFLLGGKKKKGPRVRWCTLQTKIETGQGVGTK